MLGNICNITSAPLLHSGPTYCCEKGVQPDIKSCTEMERRHTTGEYTDDNVECTERVVYPYLTQHPSL